MRGYLLDITLRRYVIYGMLFLVVIDLYFCGWTLPYNTGVLWKGVYDWYAGMYSYMYFVISVQRRNAPQEELPHSGYDYFLVQGMDYCT